MIIRLLLAGLVPLLVLGSVQADEYTGTLVKVEENKVTFSRGVGKKKQTLTLPAGDNCRVVVARYNKKTKSIEAGDDIAGGLKHPLFQKLEKEAVEAWIRTDASNERILELRLYQSTKKKTK